MQIHHLRTPGMFMNRRRLETSSNKTHAHSGQILNTKSQCQSLATATTYTGTALISNAQPGSSIQLDIYEPLIIGGYRQCHQLSIKSHCTISLSTVDDRIDSNDIHIRTSLSMLSI